MGYQHLSTVSRSVDQHKLLGHEKSTTSHTPSMKIKTELLEGYGTVLALAHSTAVIESLKSTLLKQCTVKTERELVFLFLPKQNSGILVFPNSQLYEHPKTGV